VRRRVGAGDGIDVRLGQWGRWAKRGEKTCEYVLRYSLLEQHTQSAYYYALN